MSPIVVNRSQVEGVSVEKRWQVPGGVDALHVGIQGEGGAEYAEFLTRLAEAKRQRCANETWGWAKRREQRESWNIQPGVVQVVGQTLYVRPKGFKDVPGNPCEWVADLRFGTVLGFTAKYGGKGQVAVVVELGSLDLMLNGHRNAWDNVKRFLDNIGLRVVRAMVRRVDVCTDLAGVRVDGFYDAVHDKRVVGRLRTRTNFHWTDDGTAKQGVSVYGKRVVLRIYNKVEELRSREREGDRDMAEAKREVLIERRWGGMLPESAVRVEFQVRREWLNEYGVHEVEQLFARLEAITQHLFTRFYRIVDGDVDGKRDNKNQSKLATLPLWQQVIEATLRWAGRAADELKRVAPGPRAANVKARAARFLSAMESLAACVEGAAELEYADVFQRCVDLAVAFKRPTIEMQRRIAERQEKLARVGVEGGAGVVGSSGYRVLVVPTPQFEEWEAAAADEAIDFPVVVPDQHKAGLDRRTIEAERVRRNSASALF